jgi:hypothetical protein
MAPPAFPLQFEPGVGAKFVFKSKVAQNTAPKIAENEKRRSEDDEIVNLDSDAEASGSDAEDDVMKSQYVGEVLDRVKLVSAFTKEEVGAGLPRLAGPDELKKIQGRADHLGGPRSVRGLA